MAMRGIDISNNNKGLDLASIDFDFAIMKTSQGTWFVDKYCDPWVQQCKRLGKL
jgi:lysozyme